MCAASSHMWCLPATLFLRCVFSCFNSRTRTGALSAFGDASALSKVVHSCSFSLSLPPSSYLQPKQVRARKCQVSMTSRLAQPSRKTLDRLGKLTSGSKENWAEKTGGHHKATPFPRPSPRRPECDSTAHRAFALSVTWDLIPHPLYYPEELPRVISKNKSQE